MTTLAERAQRYDHEHARSLRALAYRMLGSRAEAEDIVQEVWLRWAEVDEAGIDNPGAYLSRLATNLCLDKLGSAAVRREQYVGVWLPEPLLEDEILFGWAPSPERQAEFAQDVSIAFMLALERLSPLERAAFLLHDVFDLEYDEIGRHLERNADACRQLVSRARDHVRSAKPRYPVERAHGLEIAEAFFAASRGGEIGRLGRMLADDVSLYSDGGGKRPAAGRVMTGASEVTRTFSAINRLVRGQAGTLLRYGYVNGLPGFVTREPDGILQTTALLVENGRIKAIYVMRNPDKLRHLEARLH